MKYEGKNGEYFEIETVTSKNCYVLKETPNDILSLLWFKSDNNRIRIDSVERTYHKNDIICLTHFHKIEVIKVHELQLLRFNKPFYCILDHDSEVGCKGILYYGSSTTPMLHPSDKELEVLEAVWKMLQLEMEAKDNLQLEMLQMMLKRILILCTRIYKQQHEADIGQESNVTIRNFNYLVEQHFREHHSVTDYADLLNKSPKTLSNLFKKAGNKTPLHFIQARIMLEAKRLLRYTDKGVAEIGYELGYGDIQSFSRFFKKNEGTSPVDFRNT